MIYHNGDCSRDKKLICTCNNVLNITQKTLPVRGPRGTGTVAAWQESQTRGRSVSPVKGVNFFLNIHIPAPPYVWASWICQSSWGRADCIHFGDLEKNHRKDLPETRIWSKEREQTGLTFFTKEKSDNVILVSLIIYRRFKLHVLDYKVVSDHVPCASAHWHDHQYPLRNFLFIPRVSSRLSPAMSTGETTSWYVILLWLMLETRYSKDIMITLFFLLTLHISFTGCPRGSARNVDSLSFICLKVKHICEYFPQHEISFESPTVIKHV